MLPEAFFTMITEDFGDTLAGNLDNDIVEIDERPSQSSCQRSPDGCFAGANETDKKNGPGRPRAIV